MGFVPENILQLTLTDISNQITKKYIYKSFFLNTHTQPTLLGVWVLIESNFSDTP